MLSAATQRQSGKIMTSVSAGHILLIPIQPVASAERAATAGIKPRTSLLGVARSADWATDTAPPPPPPFYGRYNSFYIVRQKYDGYHLFNTVRYNYGGYHSFNKVWLCWVSLVYFYHITYNSGPLL